MTKAQDVLDRLVDWVSVDDLCKSTSQKPHSLRALISVESRRRGITIERQRVDGVTSYRVAPGSLFAGIEENAG